MNISATFIRKPIATAMLMAAILLLGLISYELLPVAALPNIDSPTILVTADLPGADAQTVASTVTTPLERNFGEIPGLTQMTSSSGTKYSEITLQFDRSRTVDSVAQDVQAAINATSGFLPPRLPSPSVYKKTNPANTPVLMPCSAAGDPTSSCPTAHGANPGSSTSRHGATASTPCSTTSPVTSSASPSPTPASPASTTKP
jgi:HAE1 family hydrophobic/amphiphilic exporter-1